MATKTITICDMCKKEKKIFRLQNHIALTQKRTLVDACSLIDIDACIPCTKKLREFILENTVF